MLLAVLLDCVGGEVAVGVGVGVGVGVVRRSPRWASVARSKDAAPPCASRLTFLGPGSAPAAGRCGLKQGFGPGETLGER